MSAYINRYFLLMAVFLPLWCIIRRPWKRWSLHEGCLMAFAALLFSLLCLVLRGTWAAPGDMLASALHRLRTGEGIQLRLFHTITRQLRYARREEMLINIWGEHPAFHPLRLLSAAALEALPPSAAAFADVPAAAHQH